ncbi:glycosyltransferase [Candidatus Desulfofervidus auxilii]|uniref:Glycosyltransferase n=2 Tax=Desulfofervidus auxilii TaxID=1621989 RepID=A0A7U4QKI8_DESA2|nr:glycosyltransferase [Candidatus Desulfofervidus auxilii]
MYELSRLCSDREEDIVFEVLRNKTMKIAVVTPKSVTGETGGAENFYEGLVTNFKKRGYEVDQINVLVDESSFDKILEAYCRCFYLDLNNYDLVISTKAPTYMVRHPNHVSYLLHTIRVFYDMFDLEFDSEDKEKIKQRKLIHKLDKYGLHPSRVKRHFVNGSEVYKRMRKIDSFWNAVNFEVLYHPPHLEGFKEPEEGEFIFLPGRLHRWKRVDLVIEAMKYIKHNVKLIITGEGEDEGKFKKLAKGDKRIKFLGNISQEQLIELYSKAIVVPFVPINEDYGLITIEAFKSKKPVITCIDSGEPACIVKDSINGFIVEPNPQKIAEKINYLIENPKEAKKMGEEGFKAVKEITWDNVINKLLKLAPGNQQVVPHSELILVKKSSQVNVDEILEKIRNEIIHRREAQTKKNNQNFTYDLNWQPIEVAISQAQQHAAVGRTIPGFRRHNKLKRFVFRQITKVINYVALPITRMQVFYNQAIIEAIYGLKESIQKIHGEFTRTHRKLAEINELKRECRELKQRLMSCEKQVKQLLDKINRHSDKSN